MSSISRKRLSVPALLVIFTLASCGGGGGDGGDGSPPSAPSPQGVTYDKVAVKLTTNVGEIYIWPTTPTSAGVVSFQRQAVNGVYNNSLIHRVVPGFLMQGGEIDTGNAPIAPAGTMQVDPISTRTHLKGTVGLTKTSANNSPGFFFNLARNELYDRPTGNYEVVGDLDVASRTEKTLAKILAIPRLPMSFPGPSTAFQPTTQVRFAGNLSVGNTQTILNNVVVYDLAGAPRTLTVTFDNNRSVQSGEWLMTVTDSTGTINQLERLRFQPTGLLEAGFSGFTVVNPAVFGGPANAIRFNFGEPNSSAVTNFSGGTSSTIVAEANGKGPSDGHEQPQQNVVIQQVQLLGRDRARPMPQQTTRITVAGNLDPADDTEDFEFEFYVGALVLGIDQAGIESTMRLSFVNQSSVQSGQWLLTVYNNDSVWTVQVLQFNVAGQMVSNTRTLTLSNASMFDITLSIGSITSASAGGSSRLSLTQLNGNSRWNQYVPINPSQFEQTAR